MESVHASWLGTHWGEIAQGGPRELSRKLKVAFRRLQLVNILSGVWAIPAVLIMRAFRPLLMIRLGGLTNTTRIGHFGSDGAEQVVRLHMQPANTVDWYWLASTCNSQWEAMLRRELTVRTWVSTLDWWNRRIPGGQAHCRLGPPANSRDTEGLFANCDAGLPFLPEESLRATSWLGQHGWTEGEPFVCFMVRDSTYLSNDPLQGGGRDRAKESWAYHDYRDSEIETYFPAMKWLADQGVWVLRMGKLMGAPLPHVHERVIDYAFDPGKSDLLDIWLFANCTGCVSTGTGPDSIAQVYDRPTLFVNVLPLSDIHTFGRTTWVGKHLRWANSHKRLTLAEELKESHLSSTRYEEAGVEIMDLSPREITLAVQQFWGKENGQWHSTDSDERRQGKFWNLYRAWPDFDKYHGWMHPEVRIGSAWLASLGDDYLT